MDARSDIYSLGVVLYRLVVGELPFTSERSREESGGDLLRLIREREAPAPSVLARASGRRVPREIDWIARRCLSKRPDDRYETAAALREDLERFVKREPLRAGPPTAGYRVRSFCRRRPWLVGLVGLLVVAVVASAWGLVQADRVRAAEARRAIEAQTAEVVLAFLEDLLSSIDPKEAGGEVRAGHVNLVRRAAGLLEDQRDLPAEQMFQLHRVLGSALHHIEDYGEAMEQFALAVEDASGLYGVRSAQVVDMRFALWNTAISGDGLDGIIATADEQIAAAAEVYGENSREHMRARQNYGLALERRSYPDKPDPRREEAERVFRELLKDYEEVYGPDDRGTLGVMVNLAVTIEPTGRTEEAYGLQAEAYRRMCKTLPEDNFDRNLARLNLTDYMTKRGEFEEAVREAEAVLALWRVQRGDDDRWTGWTYRVLADIHEAVGDVDAAVAVYQRLLDIEDERSERGQSVEQQAWGRGNMVGLLWRNDRRAEAAARAEEWGIALPEETDEPAAADGDGG